VDEVYQNLSVQHPIHYDACNLCDLYRKEKLSSFNVEMLKSVCKHFEISFQSKDRKHVLEEKLASMIAECSCGRRQTICEPINSPVSGLEKLPGQQTP